MAQGDYTFHGIDFVIKFTIINTYLFHIGQDSSNDMNSSQCTSFPASNSPCNFVYIVLKIIIYCHTLLQM